MIFYVYKILKVPEYTKNRTKQYLIPQVDLQFISFYILLCLYMFTFSLSASLEDGLVNKLAQEFGSLRSNKNQDFCKWFDTLPLTFWSWHQQRPRIHSFCWPIELHLRPALTDACGFSAWWATVTFIQVLKILWFFMVFSMFFMVVLFF